MNERGAGPVEEAGRPPEWTARLGRALREEGVPCTLTESLAAARALEALDPGDVTDAYLGLRAVFISDVSHAPAFDRAFWSLWGERQGEQPRGGDAPRPEGVERRPTRSPRGDGGSILDRLRPGGGDEAPPAGEEEDRDRRTGLSWSPRESLARRSFGSLTRPELRELDRAFDRLMLELATRRSRRLKAGRRGKVDVRRSLRGALRHDGELLRLARRERRIERPRVVLLCDVSGSMERYSRFLVRFLLSARRAPDVETFVFSTRLVRLTPWLAGRRVDEALAALEDRVPGWSGGTRIGACLQEFLERHGRTLLGQRSIVIVMSDGLDQGEPEPLERALRGIRRKARKVIWLNPLLESPDYRPEARGMKAALPFVDDFAPGHSLEALRRLPGLLRL